MDGDRLISCALSCKQGKEAGEEWAGGVRACVAEAAGCKSCCKSWLKTTSRSTVSERPDELMVEKIRDLCKVTYLEETGESEFELKSVCLQSSC